MSEEKASSNNFSVFDYSWEDCVRRFEREISMAQATLHFSDDSEWLASRQNWIDICQGQLDLIALLRQDIEFDNLGKMISHENMRFGIKDNGWPLWVGCRGPDHYVIMFEVMEKYVYTEARQQPAIQLLKHYVEQMQAE